jgi:hypothetical protein
LNEAKPNKRGDIFGSFIDININKNTNDSILPFTIERNEPNPNRITTKSLSIRIYNKYTHNIEEIMRNILKMSYEKRTPCNRKKLGK